MKPRVIVGSTIAALLVAGAAGAALFVWSGAYDISATAQHTQPVHDLLEGTMHRSVRRHARNVHTPDLRSAALVQRGALCYRDKCAQCHGAPGVGMGEIGRSMQPLPGPLIDAASHWKPRELYWITRHGIKMSGMPAWEYRLSDAELWAVVAFVLRLPDLTVEGYRTLTAASAEPCGASTSVASSAVAPADAARGRIALHQHACNSCHVIPGITGPDVHVGPPLKGIALRQLIAGTLPNTPEQMVRWLRAPASIDAHTTMPALGVSERDARDMAAYLATLR
jgi:mono/diheme cytochrome c family protein